MANSTYEAAMVKVTRYGRRGLNLHAHYTYAHAMDWNPDESPLDRQRCSRSCQTSARSTAPATSMCATRPRRWSFTKRPGSCATSPAASATAGCSPESDSSTAACPTPCASPARCPTRSILRFSASARESMAPAATTGSIASTPRPLLSRLQHWPQHLPLSRHVEGRPAAC